MKENINTKFVEFIDYLNSLDLKDADLYEQYSMMKNATKVLDERIDELQGMIFDEMKRLKVEKQVFEFGQFIITQRKTFSYTENVEKLNNSLKELKKKEEQEGIAKLEIKENVMFKG